MWSGIGMGRDPLTATVGVAPTPGRTMATMRPLDWVPSSTGFLIGFELSLAFSVVVVIPFTWMARPHFMGGPGPDATITDPVGLLMAAFGLLWMLRIATAEREEAGGFWRSH
jgi:hypothetical protein